MKNNSNAKPADALRILLALVFILFASLASRHQEMIEAQIEAQADAPATKRVRAREEKRQLSERPFSALINRSNGSL